MCPLRSRRVVTGLRRRLAPVRRRLVRVRGARSLERRVHTYFGDAPDLVARDAAFTARIRELDTVGQGTAPTVLTAPLSGAVSSPFGVRFGRMHFGTDYAVAAGTPIAAAAAGRVLLVASLPDYGTTTVLSHGGGLTTVYAHQSHAAVTPGQLVESGQVIGTVGATGRVTGPHLHFETRVDGEARDPAGFLPAGRDTGQAAPADARDG